MRAEAERQGRRAEQLAAWWLRLKGYRILGTRIRCARGEVDLVARRGRILIFVEVKRRATREGTEWAITAASLKRVIGAAEVLAPRYARDGDTLRIDAVLLSPGHLPRHVANIWHG